MLGGTRLKPITRYGLTVMSIGFLIDEETPMIWRGGSSLDAGAPCPIIIRSFMGSLYGQNCFANA